MSKLAVIADVHAGNHKVKGGLLTGGINARCAQIIDALGRAAADARARGCAVLVVAGDLFDSMRPSPQVIAAVKDALRQGPRDVVVMPGNHDRASDEDGDHALGPLRSECQVFATPGAFVVGRHAVVVLPFRPKPGEWLKSAIADVLAVVDGKPKASAVIAHFGISDASDNHPWVDANALPIEEVVAALSEFKIPRLLAGDWHAHRRWRGGVAQEVTQVGALCPTGWDNPGLDGYGTLMVIDLDEPDVSRGTQVVEIGGPRFVSADSPAALYELLNSRPAVHAVHAIVKAAPDALASTQAAAEALLVGKLASLQVLPDKAAVVAQAQAAAATATRAATLDAAVAWFVGSMPLAEGVDRAAVLGHCRRFLRLQGGAR